jgi:SPP1 gp7 family putative phage head morphogenesis protein
MALRDAKRLFDVSLRLQIFAEGVKAFQAQEYNKVISDITIEFEKLLGRIKFDTLDSLTKSELNKLVVTLRKSQSHVYSVYLKKLLKQLEEFMQVSLTLNRQVLVSDFLYLEDEALDEPPTDDEASDFIAAYVASSGLKPIYGLAPILAGAGSLWGRIKTEPMGANGALIEPYLKAMLGSAQVNFEQVLTKGYANGHTIREAVSAARESAGKTQAQGAATLSTAMQSIAGIVSASIGSGLFGKYRWLSVIDAGTTDVCRGRNNNVYVYGKGPLPPAHVRCRSHITPYVAGDLDKETFFSWIKRQPNSIQDFSLGSSNGRRLREGNLPADEARLKVRSMTNEEYKASINKILFG